MHLLDLPYALFDNILSYFTFDEISKLREVSRDFNQICKQILNRGFHNIERKVIAFHTRLRAKLPRRESERRLCPLNKHCEAISAVENRVSLLKICIMRNTKYEQCCFFPGKVLDEIENTCRIVTSLLDSPIQTVDILRELRDLSSMAMEYFEEHLLPRIRSKSVSTCPWNSKTPTTSIIEPPLVLPSGPLPVEELLAVSDYRRKRYQNSSLVRQDYLNNQQSTNEASLHDDDHSDIEYLHNEIRKLRRGQSLTTMRIRKLHFVLSSFRNKQRELVEQNRRISELLVIQSTKLQKLEQLMNQSLNEAVQLDPKEPSTMRNNGHSLLSKSLKRSPTRSLNSEESNSDEPSQAKLAKLT